MLAEVCRANLLALADAYGAAAGLTREQVSARFYGNRAFLKHFALPPNWKKSKSVSVDKFDEMWRAILAAWPEGAEFPPLRGFRFTTR